MPSGQVTDDARGAVHHMPGRRALSVRRHRDRCAARAVGARGDIPLWTDLLRSDAHQHRLAGPGKTIGGGDDTTAREEVLERIRAALGPPQHAPTWRSLP